MGLVRTDRVRPGMIVARDVRDLCGRLLLSQGQPISDRHVRIFKIWGVIEVDVEGEWESDREEEASVDDAAGPDSEEWEERVRQRALKVFLHEDLEHPAVKELFRLCVMVRTNSDIPWRSEQCSFEAPPPAAEGFIRDRYKGLVAGKIRLPEMPSIVYELNEVIANPLSCSDDIGKVVSKSPSLAACLLRMANSPFYGFPCRIDSISRAVTVIGTREISTLALGINILSLFRDIPPEVLDMASFIQHSLACGVVSRILAAHKNLPQTEQMFVAGLLHDIGRLIVYKYFPREARVLLHEALEAREILHRKEAEVLGCRHTEIGRYLLRKWKLPATLEDCVFYHHEPAGASHGVQAAIVHLADAMVNALGIGSSGERYMPPLDRQAWEQLSLSPGVLEFITRQAVHQLSALEPFLPR